MENIELRFVMTGDIEAEINKVRAAARGLGTDSYGVNQKLEQGAKEAAKGQSVLNNEIKETSTALDHAGKQAKETGSTLSQLKNMIGWAAVAAGAKQLVGEIINVTAEYQKYQAVLTNSLGSETLAKQSLSELTEFASKTPFALSEVTDAYVRLTSYGLQPSMEAMTAYGDLSASVGKNVVDFSEAVADATTGEFERLKEFGVKASKEGDKVTFMFKEKKTTVDFTTGAIEDYLISLGKVAGVEGSMEAISKTLGGQISNLGDNWSSLMKAMGGETDGVFVSIIKSLNEVIETATWAVKSTKTLRDEAVQKNLSGYKENYKDENGVEKTRKVEGFKESATSEITAIQNSLMNNGMAELEAKKRAIELFTKQLQEQFEKAQNASSEFDEKNKGKKFLNPFSSELKRLKKEANELYMNSNLLKGQLEILPTLFKDEKADDKKTPVVPVEFKSTPGSIARLEEELKKLKAKTGTFTNPEQETKNISAIAAKTKDIEDAWKKVREEQNKASGISLTGDNGKNDKLKLQVGLLATKTTSTQLATMKKLTKEEEDQLKIEQQKVISQIEYSDNMEELEKGLSGASNIFGSLSETAGVFDENLGDALGTMSDMTGQAAELANNIVNQNWIGVVTSGLSMITSIINAEKEAQAERIEQELTLIGLTEERIDILEQAGLITSDQAEAKRLAAQKEKLEAERLQAASYEAFMLKIKGARTHKAITFDEVLSVLYGVDWTAEEMLTALNNGNDWILEQYNEKMGYTTTAGSYLDVNLGFDKEKFNQDVNEAGQALNDLNAMLNNEDDSSKSDIASTVANGIIEGLELGSNGLGDFADGFAEMLKESAQQAILESINNDALKNFTANFQSAIEGGLTPEEKAALETEYFNYIQDSTDANKAWLEVIGTATDNVAANTDDNSLKGAIKGITEQTAGALEGKMLAIQMNTIDMRDILTQQLRVQQDIAENTSPIGGMATDIAQMKTTLKKMADATAQPQSINI